MCNLYLQNIRYLVNNIDAWTNLHFPSPGKQAKNDGDNKNSHFDESFKESTSPVVDLVEEGGEAAEDEAEGERDDGAVRGRLVPVRLSLRHAPHQRFRADSLLTHFTHSTGLW